MMEGMDACTCINALFWNPGRENRLGKKDHYEKAYTRNAEVFADVVNYLLYGGEEKIQPDDLRELDGEELLVEELVDTVITDTTIEGIFEGDLADTGKDMTGTKADSVAKVTLLEKKGPVTKQKEKKVFAKNSRTMEVFQRFRDVVKQVVVRYNEEAVYMIIGLENQTQVHYAMPVRTMVYDAMRYAGQIEAIRKQNNRQWKQKGKADETPTPAEFLSGITKKDKLLPVITIVILYSSEPWDGPTSLYDMLATKDPEILRYVQDYHIHLIAPGNMTDQQIQCFHSSIPV